MSSFENFIIIAITSKRLNLEMSVKGYVCILARPSNFSEIVDVIYVDFEGQIFLISLICCNIKSAEPGTINLGIRRQRNLSKR